MDLKLSVQAAEPEVIRAERALGVSVSTLVDVKLTCVGHRMLNSGYLLWLGLTQ